MPIKIRNSVSLASIITMRLFWSPCPVNNIKNKMKSHLFIDVIFSVNTNKSRKKHKIKCKRKLI